MIYWRAIGLLLALVGGILAFVGVLMDPPTKSRLVSLTPSRIPDDTFGTELTLILIGLVVVVVGGLVAWWAHQAIKASFSHKRGRMDYIASLRDR